MNGSLNENTSIYLQIAQLLEDNILREILLEDEQAPSTNELAKLFGINPATAAKGINLLVDEGILYKKRGIGMFVAAGSKAKIVEKRKNTFYDEFVKTLMNEAKSLSISKQELIGMIDKASVEE